MSSTLNDNRILDLFWEAVAEGAFLAEAMQRAGKTYEYHDAPWFARLWIEAERSRPWTDWGSPEQIVDARRILTFIGGSRG